MLDLLDASAIRQWCTVASTAMIGSQDAIDALNVFPVPDGDTGTNLALTLQAAAAATDLDRSTGAGTVLTVMARGAVLGARGNSGVILAQILRGMADSVDGAAAVDPAALKRALRTGADLAYSAVAEPVEGTMLSVASAAAAAAEQSGDAIGEVMAAVVAAARRALERTTGQLQVLHDAGVVDAGGCGLVVVLDALSAVVTGDAVSPVPETAGPLATSSSRLLVGARETGEEKYAYEVQYLLDSDEAAVGRLKQMLLALGDSLVVVGTGESVWNVHVHVDDIGAAIEAGMEAGRPHRISVLRFADQFADQIARSAGFGRGDRSGVAIVAVAPGEGVAEVFRAEGVHVVDGGPSVNPSTQEVLAAIVATGAESVVLLPNAAQVGGVAESAARQAREEGIVVAVVPTRSPVQGLAAIAVHDPLRRFEDDVINMAETAAATRWAEVTVAAREALTMAGRCQPGDVLGLIGGEVVEIGPDVLAVGRSVIDRLLGIGGELVTVLLGADAEPDLGDRLARHMATTAPHADATFYVGGQPNFPLLIGVE